MRDEIGIKSMQVKEKWNHRGKNNTLKVDNKEKNNTILLSA